MAAIATLNSITQGHSGFVPTKDIDSVAWFTVNGIPVVVDGAAFLPHTDGKSVHQGKASSSRSWLTIGGKGVVCVGDKLSCGDVIASGDGSLNVS